MCDKIKIILTRGPFLSEQQLIYVIVALKAFAMPEFTITKYCNFILGDDDIRMAAAHLIILAVADTFVPQSLAQEDFNFGILTANGLHIFMTLFFRQLVHCLNSLSFNLFITNLEV